MGLFGKLIDCMVFNAVFNSISVISKPLAAFPHNHFWNNGHGKRGEESCPMTIINPQKEYWPSLGSNQQPTVLKSTMLLTELLGSTLFGKGLIKQLNEL